MKDQPPLITMFGNAVAIAVLGFAAFLFFGAAVIDGLIDFARWMGMK